MQLGLENLADVIPIKDFFFLNSYSYLAMSLALLIKLLYIIFNILKVSNNVSDPVFEPARPQDPISKSTTER